jgi:membrane-bound lytic murein transglycosylase
VIACRILELLPADQGSGQIALDTGGRLRLGYADQNGHPYRSIGRFLVERREMTLDQASMQGIKAWATANPRKLREALDSNPSYVFFREMLEGDAGPIGTLGVLSAGYSIAVDPRPCHWGAGVSRHHAAISQPQAAGRAGHQRRDPRAVRADSRGSGAEAECSRPHAPAGGTFRGGGAPRP